MSELDKVDKNLTTGTTQLSNLFNVHLGPGDPNFKTFCDALEKCTIAAATSNLDVKKQMLVSAEHLGNSVEKRSVDAHILEGWQNSQRFKRSENGAATWVEKEVDTSHQLPTPESLRGSEMVMISRDITQKVNQSERVLEVVAVTREGQPALPEDASLDTFDLERTNSPFLLKKAA